MTMKRLLALLKDIKLMMELFELILKNSQALNQLKLKNKSFEAWGDWQMLWIVSLKYLLAMLN